MLTTAGGPISGWSQSTAREIGNVSGAHEVGFSHTLLPTEN